MKNNIEMIKKMNPKLKPLFVIKTKEQKEKEDLEAQKETK